MTIQRPGTDTLGFEDHTFTTVYSSLMCRRGVGGMYKHGIIRRPCGQAEKEMLL